MNEKYLALEQEALNENTSPKRLDELADVPYLAALVAENVNTSPETFTKLAINKNEDILKAIVSNPSTPTEILIELGSLYPQQLVKNPIVDLWLLEDNNPFLYKNLFKKDFARKRTTPVKLLEILARDSNYRVRLEVAANPNTPVYFLEILARDSIYGVRLEVAANPNTPVSLLEILARDSDSNVRLEVAANPNTPVSLLEILARDSNYRVRLEVAANPNTPVSLLEILARDSDSNVRLKVVKKLNTPVSLLEILARDSDSNVRLEVVKNPNIPVSLLEILACDSDSNVRLEVVKNPNIPVSLLEILACDSDSNVRLEVVKNPNTPVSLLEILAYDYDPLVCDTTSIYFVYRVLTDDNTPVSLLQKSVNQLKHNQGFLSLLSLSKPIEECYQVCHFRRNDLFKLKALVLEIANDPNTPLNLLQFIVENSPKYVDEVVYLGVRCDIPVAIEETENLIYRGAYRNFHKRKFRA